VRYALLLPLFGLLLLGASGPGLAFPTVMHPSVELRSYGGGDVAVGDFNGDGWRDIAWTYVAGDMLYLHDQRADGFLSDPGRSASVPGPSRIAAEDIDADGRPDLAVLSRDGALLFTDLTAPSLAPAWTLAVGSGTDLTLGDLNGDGRLDLAVLTPDVVRLWFQDASGAFQPTASVEHPMPDFLSMAVRDLDADGRAELIVAKPWEVRILSFQGSARPIDVREMYSEGLGDRVTVRAGDMDRDGRMDLVLAKADRSAGTGAVEVWHQGADGTFVSAVVLSGPLTDRAVVEDLNDDGDLDVAVVRTDGDVSLWTQVAAGAFSPLTPQRLEGTDPGWSSVLAPGDVNGDAYPDLVLRGEDSASLSVFLQEDRAPSLTGLAVPSNVWITEGETRVTEIDLRAYIHDDHDATMFFPEVVSGVLVEPFVQDQRLGIRAPPGVFGVARLRVTGTDNVPGHSPVTTNEFTVSVNARPRIEGRPPTEIPAGTLSFYRFHVSDPWPSGAPHRIVLLDAPEGMRVDARVPAVRWTPTLDQVGVHDVQIAAEDDRGGRSAPLVFVITVFAPAPAPPPDPLPVIAAGGALVTLGAVGAGAAVSENVRWTLLLAFLPLYSKIKREEVLDHFVRGQIYGYILSSPGEHYNAIKQALHLTNGSLAHHLKTLEREEFIRSRRYGLYRRFYPRNYRIPESDAFFLNPIQQRLLGMAADTPGISQKEVSDRLGLTPPTVNYHVSLLSEHGYLRVARNGRRTELYSLSLGENGGNGEETGGAA